MALKKCGIPITYAFLCPCMPECNVPLRFTLKLETSVCGFRHLATRGAGRLNLTYIRLPLGGYRIYVDCYRPRLLLSAFMILRGSYILVSGHLLGVATVLTRLTVRLLNSYVSQKFTCFFWELKARW